MGLLVDDIHLSELEILTKPRVTVGARTEEHQIFSHTPKLLAHSTYFKDHCEIVIFKICFYPKV